MILETGQEIEKYVVEDVLGEGGMAAVYRVRHRTLDASFALKVLTVPNRKVRDRMIQEGRIQATIRHANVVQVVDVLDVGGMTGLLMEYVAGPPLDRLLLEYRPTLDEALALFGGLMAGVEAAHRLGLVHRDLKPENVLLRLGEDGITPKIADFGIAKASEEGTVNTTRPGAAMGTPAYMAPEQVRDASTVTPSADVYSLGAILYELVSGQKAFPGDHALDILNSVVKGEYIPLEALNLELPAPVLAAVRGAMEVNPVHRIQTVAELASILAERPLSHVAEAFPTRVDPGSALAARARALGRRTPAPVVRRTLTPQSTGSQDTLFPTPTAEVPKLPAPAPSAARWALVGVPLATGLFAAVGVLGLGAVGLGAWVYTRGQVAEAEVAALAAAAVVEPSVTVAPPIEAEEEVPVVEPLDASSEVVDDTVVEASLEAVESPAAPPGSPAGTAATSPKGTGASPPPKPALVVRGDSTLVPKSIAELKGPAVEAAPVVDPATAVAEIPQGMIPSAEPPAGGKNKPARIKLEPPATKVMLQDGDQYFTGTGRIPPGTYIVHVWYDSPVPKPQGRVQLQPGETVTLACRPEWSYCQRR